MADGTEGALAEADARRIRRSFESQSFPAALGLHMTALERGRCVLALERRDDLLQQHGYIHAGVVSTLADTAAGYAALTVMPADANVLTVEFKINLLAPAAGDALVAEGRVLRGGRRLVVVSADVCAETAGERRTVAAFQGTMICLREHSGGGAPAG